MRHITQQLGVTGGQAVDIGCGRGDQLFALQRLGFEVTGLDLERSADGIPNHHIFDVGADRFPLPDAVMDLSSSKVTIDNLYMTQIKHFMLDMRRATKLGGRVALTASNWRYMCHFLYLFYTCHAIYDALD